MPQPRPALRFALTTAAAFAGGALSAHLATATPARESPYDMLEQLGRALVLIENEYVEPVDRRRLVEGADDLDEGPTGGGERHDRVDDHEHTADAGHAGAGG